MKRFISQTRMVWAHLKLKNSETGGKMRGLNSEAVNKYQNLCSRQVKMEEKLSNGNLSEEEEKKLRFDLKSLRKGTEKARKQLAGY